MENMIAQDMARGDGVMVLDPHGTLAETCLHLVPPQRMNYVGLFDPTDRINNRIALFVIDTQSGISVSRCRLLYLGDYMYTAGI